MSLLILSVSFDSLLSNVYETFNGVFDANEERDNTSALSENLLHSKRLLGTEEALLLTRNSIN